MPEFRITVQRTLTQERTVLVSARNEDAIWIDDEYEDITDLSDWETTYTSEEIAAVEDAP